MDKLIEIRHSKMVTKKKNGEEYQEPCNKKLCAVAPGSSGIAYCIQCKEDYPFEVLKDNQSASLYDILHSVNTNVVQTS